MTATVKSVLFVDYDSLYLSLRARDPGMARRFASRPGVWLDAIESGLLISSEEAETPRRRILMRRCYADPKLIGKARSAFAAEGFQIVDCPPLPGRDRNSADIHMVLDTIDAIGHPTSFDEFILLSADSDLTPILFRLRSHNRSTTVYATSTTSTGYRAVADAAIDENGLVAVLATTADAEAPEADSDYEGSSGRGGELAALARRVHQATNVPLLPPKVYGELFKALAQEVAENGYHFQATAENVAARLIASGRNASRRQVAFVVKGLALKGHVFSVADTAERLADVFREQVLYLARHAGIELDDTIERQIQVWIVGRGAASAETAPAADEPDRAELDELDRAEVDEADVDAPAEAATSQAEEGVDEDGLDLPDDTEIVAAEVVEVAPASEPVRASFPTIVVRDPAAEPLDVAPPVRPEPRDAPAGGQAPPVTIAAPMALVTPGEAVIALPPPAEETDKAVPAVRSPDAHPGGAIVVRTAVLEAPPSGDGKPADGVRDPIQSTLLAAIAEAVDVTDLDDEDVDAPVMPVVEPEAEEAAEGEGDIGDEIQRILKAYSQSRKA